MQKAEELVLIVHFRNEVILRSSSFVPLVLYAVKSNC